MEDSFRRAEAAEKKHKEKMAKMESKRESLQQQVAPAKEKHVKKLISTQDKHREQMRRERTLGADEEAPPEEEGQFKLRKDDGTELWYAQAAQDIIAFLQDQGTEATLDEIHRGVGIDLLQDARRADGSFLGQDTTVNALKNNPCIEPMANSSGASLRYRAWTGLNPRP